MAQCTVKGLRCSTCERMSRSRSHRPSRIPTDGERFNEELLVDLCDLVDVRGNRYWWFVAVDQHTDCTVIAPCASHESQAFVKKIFKHWTPWAGPRTYWCVTESGVWEPLRFSQKNSRCQGLRCKPQQPILRGRRVESNRGSQPSRKWRARRVLQHQVAGRSAMSVVSYEVAHALNQRAGRLGILPATRVFGQRKKVHGELTKHGEVVPHPKVVDEGDELARRFIIRTSAREALEEPAASEAIRRAAATRSRPMETFEPSTLCFFYRHHPGKRAERAMRGRYLGPVALIGPHGRSS